MAGSGTEDTSLAVKEKKKRTQMRLPVGQRGWLKLAVEHGNTLDEAACGRKDTTKAIFQQGTQQWLAVE